MSVEPAGHPDFLDSSSFIAAVAGDDVDFSTVPAHSAGQSSLDPDTTTAVVAFLVEASAPFALRLEPILVGGSGFSFPVVIAGNGPAFSSVLPIVNYGGGIQYTWLNCSGAVDPAAFIRPVSFYKVRISETVPAHSLEFLQWQSLAHGTEQAMFPFGQQPLYDYANGIVAASGNGTLKAEWSWPNLTDVTLATLTQTIGTVTSTAPLAFTFPMQAPGLRLILHNDEASAALDASGTIDFIRQS